MTLEILGAGCFGLVVGWVTYRTLRHSPTTGLSDLAAVIGAVGGGTVTMLFPAGTQLFGAYAIGLAVGFFLYVTTAMIVAARTEGLTAVNEWLGIPQNAVPGRGGAWPGGAWPGGSPPGPPPPVGGPGGGTAPGGIPEGVSTPP